MVGLVGLVGLGWGRSVGGWVGQEKGGSVGRSVGQAETHFRAHHWPNRNDIPGFPLEGVPPS